MTMPDDVTERIDYYRELAGRKLDWQAMRAAAYQMYYDGEQVVPVIMDTRERRIFRRLLDEAGANWCELIVNAVAERLIVTGFQFGDVSDQAWAIWQDNRMSADSELVQTDALIAGSSFVLVQPDEQRPTGVSITAESPQEATVLYEPGSRFRRTAAFKRFGNEDGALTEILILPDLIATWRPPEPGQVAEVEVTGNPGTAMVEIVPQPRTLGAPRSELKPARPIQDRIHTTIFNRLVATDYGAFRQIWATGMKLARQVLTDDDGQPQTDEATGRPKTRPVAPVDIGANRLLVNENPEGRWGSFPESTLQGYLSSVEQDVNQLAAITQTPPHYLLGRIANLSADAITAAEAGLVAKTRKRARHIGEGWAEVMRLALGLVGSEGTADVLGEVVWADPETRSLAQLADALQKMASIGVPHEVLWERWGATPQELERWRELAQQEQAELLQAQAAAVAAAQASIAGGNQA